RLSARARYAHGPAGFLACDCCAFAWLPHCTNWPDGVTAPAGAGEEVQSSVRVRTRGGCVSQQAHTVGGYRGSCGGRRFEAATCSASMVEKITPVRLAPIATVRAHMATNTAIADTGAPFAQNSWWIRLAWLNTRTRAPSVPSRAPMTKCTATCLGETSSGWFGRRGDMAAFPYGGVFVDRCCAGNATRAPSFHRAAVAGPEPGGPVRACGAARGMLWPKPDRTGGRHDPHPDI